MAYPPGPAHVEFCGEESFGPDDWGWYVVFPDGDGIGPLADKEEAHALAREINARAAV